MTKETKELVLSGLRALRGDNYMRAKASFSRFTPEQMQRIWGESGQTCQEILDGYKIHSDRIDKAITEVMAL